MEITTYQALCSSVVTAESNVCPLCGQTIDWDSDDEPSTCNHGEYFDFEHTSIEVDCFFHNVHSWVQFGDTNAGVLWIDRA